MIARRRVIRRKADAAIAMLELNGEFYPKSAEIDFQLAELHRGRGERDKALARYRAVLVKSPDNRFAKQPIDELEKKD
jgi:lipopolysaccharide biosynthesis regulator YciM